MNAETARALQRLEWNIDSLPAGCAIEVEAVIIFDGLMLARFRAVRARRLRRNQRSEWSGWFRYAGTPIVLHWAAFWPDAP